MASPSSSSASAANGETWAEDLDALIAKFVFERMAEAKRAPAEYNAVDPRRWSSPPTAGAAVTRLFILNARQWHLEDLCCASKENDLAYGDMKKRIEHCFKNKRPELIRALNRHLARTVAPGWARTITARHPLLLRAWNRLRCSHPLHRVRDRLPSLPWFVHDWPRAMRDRQFVSRGLDKVVFFNCTHNGDLHLSREFVRHLASAIDAKCFAYAHFSPPKTLRDLPRVSYVSLYDLHEMVPVVVRDSCHCLADMPYLIDRGSRTLFINTWIGQQRARYLLPGPSGRRDQVTLEGNHRMYSDLINRFGLKKRLDRNPRTYIPTIDYEQFDIARARDHFSEKRRGVRVFIANSPVRSQQIANFDFSPVVLSLASRFPEVDFYLTSKEPFGADMPSRENVLFTADVISANGGDLNENSFVSRFCDIIVGRESGPFEFCKVKENLFDPSKTFICFSRNQRGAFWYTGFVEARRVWSESTAAGEVARVIAEEIERTRASRRTV